MITFRLNLPNYKERYINNCTIVLTYKIKNEKPKVIVMKETDKYFNISIRFN